MLIGGVVPGGDREGCSSPCDVSQSLPVTIWGITDHISLIHGGGWMLGSSDSIPFNQVKYLLDHGVAVASVEYRLAPQ